MSISLTSTITISNKIIIQEVDNETVLLDLHNEIYFGLDEIGTHIWQLLQEHKQLQEVYDIILQEYDVSEQQLENDFNALLQQLVEKSLVTLT